jgi:hypothetical protein
VIALGAILLVGAALAVLRLEFSGPSLASNISSVLNKRMRGRIEIGSIEWPTAGLREVLRGGWVPLTLRDVHVWDDCALSAEITDADSDEVRTGDPNEDCTPDERRDPDPASRRKPRKLLVRAPLITAEIDVHALMFGKHDVVLRRIWIHGGEALLEETLEPYPLHAYDRTIVSIITAFYPRMRAGFRAGIYADSPPPVFDLRDIHVRGLNLTAHFNPYRIAGTDRIAYATTARLKGVEVDAGPQPRNDSFLYMDPTDPLVAKLYVRLGVTARRGVVRIQDEGPRAAFRLPAESRASAETPALEVYPPPGRTAEYQIALTDIRLNRLAQLPSEWSRRDFVANTLELDLQARTVPCATADAPHPDPARGAELHLTGELQNYWDRPYDGAWNLALAARGLGPTIRTCILRAIGGDQLDGRITLTGPFVAAPAIGLELRSLDYDLALSAGAEPLRLTLAEVHGKIDLVNEQGYIDKTKALIRGGREPGEVAISATFGLQPYNAHASVDITKAIDVGRFLPPAVVTAAGRFLQGRLRANGDTELGFALEDFDLALGVTPGDRALRVHRGRLFTSDDFDTIKVERVAVDAGRNRAVFDGWVKPAANDHYMEITGPFPDLGVWLKRFQLPDYVSSAYGGKIISRGKLTAPTVTVLDYELAGVPCIDQLKIETAVVGDGRVTARVRSSGLGGELTGSLQATLGGAVGRVDRLAVTGSRLDAARLCGLGSAVRGTLDYVEGELVGATVDPTRPPLEWLDHVRLFARAARLTVAGDRLEDAGVCINRRDAPAACSARVAYLDADDRSQCEAAQRGGFCAVAVARRSGGGQLAATVAKIAPPRGARPGTPAQLGGTLAVSDLPLALLEQFLGARLTGGLASARLHLQGTPDAPQAAGTLTLLRAWAQGAFLGDAQLAIEPASIAVSAGGNLPGVAIRGTALAGRVQIRGVLGTAAPYPVELTLSGRRLELDVLLDLQRRLGLQDAVQAWATGSITVRAQLLPAAGTSAAAREPEAWIELSELSAIYNLQSADGRITPIRVTAVPPPDRDERTAVSLRVTPTTLELACQDRTAPSGRRACPLRLATPIGVVEAKGYVRPDAIAISAAGTLDLGLLGPIGATVVDEISGRARLTASIGGTAARPTYEAAIELADATARPIGVDTVLEAPSGLIKLANGSLGFTDLRLRVRDQHRDESGELHVKGNVALAGLQPQAWGVLISGKLAGKMLVVVAPALVSSASGLARIDGNLVLSGAGPRPTISGAIVFDPPPTCAPGHATAPDGTECRAPGDLQRPIAIIPRGLRRELAFTRGRLEIDTGADQATYTIALGDRGDESARENVRVVIDGESSIDAARGEVVLRDGAIALLDVRLNASRLPFRIPGTLDLDVSAAGIALVRRGAASPLEISGEVSIVEGKYQRDLTLTDQLIALGASGPPTRPIWEEYPTLGNARLSLALAIKRFAVANNIANIELGAEQIQVTNTPRDPRLSGQIDVKRGEFRIPGTRARFTRTTGSILFAENEVASNPTLAIASDAPDYRDLSGQNHVITLRISGPLQQLGWDLTTSTGYNKSQTLSLLVLGRNAEQLRRSLGDQSLGADPLRVDPTTNPSQGFADQIVKDIAGEWVSGLLGDSLGRMIGLDVLRIEVGFGSIGFHIEKKVLENLKALIQTEQTIRGNTLDMRGELKTPYGFSVELGYLNKNFNDPAEQDIEDAGLKAVYRLFIP